MKASRIVLVDALRGFALAGVALVHMGEQYLGGPAPDGLLEAANQGWLDSLISGFIGLFFFGKFFALFSILFGFSFYLQMKLAEDRGESFGGRFLWRAFWLLVFGLIHQCFYKGDILFIYATLVPVLLPFYRIQTKWVLAVAVLCFLSLGKVISFAIWGDQPIFGEFNFMDGNHPAYVANVELLRNGGSFWEIAQVNLTQGMGHKMDFQLSFFGRYYYTFGYFLMGMLIGRIQLFREVDRFLPYRKKAIWVSVLLLVGGVALLIPSFAMAGQPPDFSRWSAMLGMNFFDWINLALTALILIGFLSWYRTPKGEHLLSVFAPYGRMALTNYVLQSVIGTFLLFPWGLGLFGQLRNYQLFLMAIALITLQTLFSRWWLQQFRYGPLEWLWRSLTYLKIQPFRK